MKYSPSTLDQKRLLKDISIIDFVLVEMTEYLDIHPEESQAIDYFNNYVRLKNQLLKEFSAKYYPLTLTTADTYCKEWKWALAPLPWEGVC